MRRCVKDLERKITCNIFKSAANFSPFFLEENEVDKYGNGI